MYEFTEKANVVLGFIVAFLTFAFGEHYILFVTFLGLNVLDFVTRWIAASLTQTERSKNVAKGILKKLGYWIMIGIGFGVARIFKEIGDAINVDLAITSLIGWFVMATLTINELRSILENLLEGGYQIPSVLVRGLQIADKTLNKVIDNTIPEIPDTETKNNEE